MEEWRPVVGFEGRYEISNLGNVRSVRRKVWVTRRGRTYAVHKGGRPLKAHEDRGGYLRLSLRVGSKCHLRFVHCLVCEAFHGPRPLGHEAAHNDGTRTKNRADNLRWATPKENAADRLLHGTDGTGEKNPRALLTEADVREIRRRYVMRYGAIAALAREYGVDRGVIDQLVHRRSWRHVD